MLELRGVSAGYGRTKVVDGVNLTVPDEGAVSIMGHNGAGKTTLLRAVVGLIPVRSGSIVLDGQEISKWRPNKRVRRGGIAYVPQGQLSFGQMTTMENLQTVADGRRNGAAKIEEMLELFPVLKELLGRRAGLLSGGQRQQLSIARALITQPRMLILDEPTEGIQPNVVADIERVIIDLTKTGGLSVLLVEQHVGFALRATGKYYVLESGRITSSGDGGAQAVGTVRAVMAL